MRDKASFLKEGLDAVGLEYNDTVIGLLIKYVGEITLWNKKYGLVNARGDELITGHILDSLAPLPLLREIEFKTLADAGSGAGLPGIPLALFLENRDITLIERSERRVGFLRNALSLLGLNGRVKVISSSVEDVRERFDIVTFRAFRQLGEFYLPLNALLNDGGSLFAYKGRREKIDDELGEIEKETGSVPDYSIKKVIVPFLEKERHILILPRHH